MTSDLQDIFAEHAIETARRITDPELPLPERIAEIARVSYELAEAMMKVRAGL